MRADYNRFVLGRIFIGLCGVPGLKKRLWRAWYEYLTRSNHAPEWTFMNYGYSAPGLPILELEESDERDRHCIQLYDHVTGAVDLNGSDVLEIGSGRGGGSSFIKRYRGAARMMGVDLSRNAVDFSRATHRVEGLEFRVGDAEDLPFEDSSFDAVINVESSHCYPSFEKFLSEVRRVLRAGGYFLYADFRDRETVERWRHMLQDSDFEVLGETDITPNVIAALEQDNERKLELIERLIPGFLRPSFCDFAAMRGSALFKAFESRNLVYRSFILRNMGETIRGTR
jgi:ubiquinone/menaquinone biosynthesis C-methylase UbiE